MLKRLRDTRDFLAYLRFRAHVRRDWRIRHRKVLTLTPAYRNPAPARIEREHLRYWRRFDPIVSLETLRICNAVSGHADVRIVPEEIFAVDIGRCLNRLHWAPLLSHKSFYRSFFDSEMFPRCFLHRIDGQYYDSDGDPVGPSKIASAVHSWPYPLVLKPNTGSSGGAGIHFLSSPEDALCHISSVSNFVIQERVEQAPFFCEFNRNGLNTIRVYSYRSPVSGQAHVLNAALRMGQGGTLDNVTAGGLVCYIRPDGTLNSVALNKYAATCDRHPDTAISFSSVGAIPRFRELHVEVLKLADRLPMMAVAGWDMCLDDRGRWRCIEVNLGGHTIRFAQYSGQPFFGEHTDEVASYCLSHPLRRRMEVKVL